MAKRKMTPPFGVRGYWEVEKPFKVNTLNEYQCVAIRSFNELFLKGMDVYREFYQTMGLEESAFQEDEKAHANIVVLQDDHGDFIHIPDTYILKFPNIKEDNFKRVVLSVDLGALPVGYGTSHLTATVSKELEKALGRSVSVKQHLAPLVENKLTPNELKRAEKVRRAATTKNITPGGKYLALNQKYGDLLAYTKRLEAQVKTKTSESARELQALKHRAGELEREAVKLRTQNEDTSKQLNESRAKETKQARRISQLERALIGAGMSLPT